MVGALSMLVISVGLLGSSATCKSYEKTGTSVHQQTTVYVGKGISTLSVVLKTLSVGFYKTFWGGSLEPWVWVIK